MRWEFDKLNVGIVTHPRSLQSLLRDDASLIDALAAEILRRLEGWGAAYPYRDGKVWLPQSLAVDLLLRYGGALQRLML